MDMTLTRRERRPDGIFSSMEDDTDRIVAWTLEHAYPQDDGSYQPKIQNGVYTCRRRLSPHFEYDVFQVLSVPGCDFIEIHRGNFNRDSEGCILLGQAISDINGVRMITNSRITFDYFMSLQNDLDTFQIKVTG